MERSSAQISAIFHSPFHTKGTGTSKGLTGLFARNMNINWVRKKQNDFFFFFPLVLTACLWHSQLWGWRIRWSSQRCMLFQYGQQHQALKKHSPKQKILHYLHSDPILLFFIRVQQGKCFFLHFPTAHGAKLGDFHPQGQDQCETRNPDAATPPPPSLGLSDAEGVVRRARVGYCLYFFSLNESNLINITVRSLVWKQCKAKFSNHSLCHITLGTFVRGAHLAPPALTSPSTPSSHTSAHHWWSAGLIGPLNSNKIHQIINIFGKPTRS